MRLADDRLRSAVGAKLVGAVGGREGQWTTGFTAGNSVCEMQIALAVVSIPPSQDRHSRREGGDDGSGILRRMGRWGKLLLTTMLAAGGAGGVGNREKQGMEVMDHKEMMN